MATTNVQPCRLSTELVAAADSVTGGFTYSRPDCGVGIVHLGIGAFHRAHQAAYTDAVLANNGGDWKILGVSLRSGGVRDQLHPQDYLYTLVEMDSAGSNYRVIAAVDNVLVAPENPQRVLDALINANCKIISLTITEKGYCHHPATGRLNRRHADIVHDLAKPLSPVSAIGFIVEALRRRRQLNTVIPTVMCCDNLPDNGTTLKRLVVEFAALTDAELAHWIERCVPFPNTMVDRIVPATQAEDISELQQHCGYRDLGMVKAERFSQWVIEDNFASGRPAWETVGATLVSNVEPFEVAKLRLLNGAHSSLAYLGFLAGYEYVHQVMKDTLFRQFVQRLMTREIAPTVDAPQGMDVNAYIDSLLERFANPNLNHKTYQIAMDGSQKLPQRLLATLAGRLAAGQSIEHMSLAIAGWVRYALAFDERGADILVQDPLANIFATIKRNSTDSADGLLDIDKLVDGFVNIEAVFGTDLPQNHQFRSRLRYWLGHILANGVATTLDIFLTGQATETSYEH